MQKTGQIERTVDREFADEEAKFKTCVSVHFILSAQIDCDLGYSFEKECQALQKDSKSYIDAMKGRDAPISFTSTK